MHICLACLFYYTAISFITPFLHQKEFIELSGFSLGILTYFFNRFLIPIVNKKKGKNKTNKIKLEFNKTKKTSFFSLSLFLFFFRLPPGSYSVVLLISNKNSTFNCFDEKKFFPFSLLRSFLPFFFFQNKE